MTTIAYRDGIFAADGQLTVDDHIKLASDPKIRVVSKNTVIAGAGDTGSIERMFKYFSDPNWREKEEPDVKKDTSAIVWHEGQAYYCFGSVTLVPLCHPFFAIGTGSELALAALHFGLSAYDAVKFASELDVYTNDKIQVFDVKNLQEARPRKTSRTKPKEA